MQMQMQNIKAKHKSKTQKQNSKAKLKSKTQNMRILSFCESSQPKSKFI
jgi:hypothetical protein